MKQIEVGSSDSFVELYRVENPNIPRRPGNSDVSHEAITGMWFDTNLDYVLNYLDKATFIRGRDPRAVHGARLVIAHLAESELPEFHYSAHPIAKEMDVEPTNYILPRDNSVQFRQLDLDPIIQDLVPVYRGENLVLAKDRVSVAVGELSLASMNDPES